MSNLITSSIPTLLCDFYKVSHRAQYPTGTTVIYSTLTPRTNKYAPEGLNGKLDKVVVFGFQYLIQKYLIEFFNNNFFDKEENDVVNQYKTFIKETLGTEDDGEHLRALHKLGYLPLRIKTIPEGTAVAIKVPVLTIENTHPEFYWLTNYFETLISCMTWQPMTSATITKGYLDVVKHYAELTCDNFDHIPFQCHDFSMRGMGSLETAELSGLGHLTSFVGTDTIPAISAAKYYYGATGLVGTSIPATEHSVMSSHGLNEIETFRFLMKTYPTGLFSVVSDTYDFWKNIRETLPALRKEIMSRDGKVVIRPDSGDPVKIICGTLDYVAVSHLYLAKSKKVNDFYSKVKVDDALYDLVDVIVHGDQHSVTYTPVYQFDKTIRECTEEEIGLIEALWKTFGGTINSKGYRVLDPHIGAIYGDSITLQRANEILSALKLKGYASSNIVFGVGSYTHQYNTRDTFGFAIKATHAVINGEQKQIFKDPKTDSGMKKSQRGRVKVLSPLSFVDQLDIGEDEGGLLETVFEDGKLVKVQNFNEIRRMVQNG